MAINHINALEIQYLFTTIDVSVRAVVLMLNSSFTNFFISTTDNCLPQ